MPRQLTEEDHPSLTACEEHLPPIRLSGLAQGATIPTRSMHSGTTKLKYFTIRTPNYQLTSHCTLAEGDKGDGGRSPFFESQGFARCLKSGSCPVHVYLN